MKYSCVIHITSVFDYRSKLFDTEEEAVKWQMAFFPTWASYTLERSTQHDLTEQARNAA